MVYASTSANDYEITIFNSNYYSNYNTINSLSIL